MVEGTLITSSVSDCKIAVVKRDTMLPLKSNFHSKKTPVFEAIEIICICTCIILCRIYRTVVDTDHFYAVIENYVVNQFASRS